LPLLKSAGSDLLLFQSMKTIHLLALGSSVISFSALRVGPNLAVYDILFLVAIVTAAMEVANKLPSVPKSSLPICFFLVLALVGLLVASIFGSNNPLQSLVAVARFSFCALLFLYFAPIVAGSAKDASLLATGLAVGGLFAGVGAIAQAAFGLEGGLFGNINQGRMVGFTEHPNELGFIGATTLFFSLFLIRFGIVAGALKTVIFFGVVSSCVAVILSASMTAAASVLFGVLVLVISDIRQQKYLFPALIGVTTLGLVALYPLLQLFGGDNAIDQRISSFLTQDSGQSTLDLRNLTYQLALERISASPFIGAGSSHEDFLLIEDYFIHNLFLRAWYEGGLLSFIGFVGIFFSVFRVLFPYLSPQSVEPAAASYITAIFFTILIGCLLAPMFYQRVLWLEISALIILTNLLAKSKEIRLTSEQNLPYKISTP
jgi:O-antigen ligase